MDSSFLQQALRGPLPLTPNNFTPRARTPWGGTFIAQQLKDAVSPETKGAIVGESWDFSCEPSFPSRLLGSSLTLHDLFRSYPKETLSATLFKQDPMAACEILVKFVDAQEDLSLQVHPSDSDPFLGKEESGKPESWLILHAEPGAGIYLGFQSQAALSHEGLAQILRSGADLRRFLQFVPVKAGDYFEIPAGICHAVGKGITLLEPQRVLFGKKARTYRMYDWGRRYNAKGEADPEGKGRELHIEESLHLVQPTVQCGDKFLAQLRSLPRRQNVGEGIRIDSFGHNPFYRTHRVQVPAQQTLHWNLEDAYGALLPTEGYFKLRSADGADSYWQKGQPGLLPAACFPLTIQALHDTTFYIVNPLSAKIQWWQN